MLLIRWCEDLSCLVMKGVYTNHGDGMSYRVMSVPTRMTSSRIADVEINQMTVPLMKNV